MFGFLELAAPICRDFVVTPDFSFVQQIVAFEQFRLLQRMKQRVERPRADPVAMFRKLLDQPEAINRLLRCMVQNMELDKSGEQVQAGILFDSVVFIRSQFDCFAQSGPNPPPVVCT